MLLVLPALSAPLHTTRELPVEVHVEAVTDPGLVTVGAGSLTAVAACSDGSYFGVLEKGSQPTELLHVAAGRLSRVSLASSGTVAAADCLADGTLVVVHDELIAAAAHLDRWKPGATTVTRWTWDLGGQDPLVGLFDVVALSDGGFAIAGRSTGALGDLALSLQGERSFVSAFDAKGALEYAHPVPRADDAGVYADAVHALQVHPDGLFALLDRGSGTELSRQLVRFDSAGMQLVDPASVGQATPVPGSFEARRGWVERPHARLTGVWDPKYRVRALSLEHWEGGRALQVQTTAPVYGLGSPVAGTAFLDGSVVVWGSFSKALFGVEEPEGDAAFVARFTRGGAPVVRVSKGQGDQRVSAGDVLPDGRLVLGFTSSRPVELGGTQVLGAAFVLGSADTVF